MSIYIGDCSFAEVEGRQYAIDPWSLDNVTVFIEGRRDHLATYMATMKRKRNIPLDGFPGLFLMNYDITDGRSMAKAAVHYAGVYTNEIPEPVFTPGYRTQSVTLPFILTAGGDASAITSTFEYIAPFTRVMYAVKENSLTPQYRGYVKLAKGALQIVSRSGAAGALAIFKGKYLNTQTANQISPQLTYTANCYNAVAESVTPTFDIEPVGQWYRITEMNEVRLIPLDLVNAGYSEQI